MTHLNLADKRTLSALLPFMSSAPHSNQPQGGNQKRQRRAKRRRKIRDLLPEHWDLVDRLGM